MAHTWTDVYSSRTYARATHAPAGVCTTQYPCYGLTSCPASLIVWHTHRCHMLMHLHMHMIMHVHASLTSLAVSLSTNVSKASRYTTTRSAGTACPMEPGRGQGRWEAGVGGQMGIHHMLLECSHTHGQAGRLTRRTTCRYMHMHKPMHMPNAQCPMPNAHAQCALLQDAHCQP